MIRYHLLAALLAATLLGSCGSGPSSEGAQAASQAPPESLPPLDRPPLDPPLRVTATFGEYRRGHFHGGLDFSTERRVGLPVFAPASGYIERIRTSGSGFGRALMIRTADGRTILLAHLDAFDEPIASFAAAAQDSSGNYELELSPPKDALPVQAGQRIAWSGESGAGPPHLHMEVRHGDWAYNPLRHGLELPDSFPPVLRRVILEPIDDVSYVEGGSVPRSFALPQDTVVVEGRVRVWIDALDGVTEPLPRAAPYAASLEWKGSTVECRFDRIAWDEDMVAVEWVYDGSGSISTLHPMGLWLAPGFRPSMIATTGSGGEPGVVAVQNDDPPHTLTLMVRDVAGNRTEHRVVIRPPAPHERSAPSAASATAASRRGAATRSSFEITPVQGSFVRIHYTGLTHGSRNVALGLAGDELATRPASFRGGRWSAVVRAPRGVTAVFATGTGATGSWKVEQPLRIVALSPDSGATITAGEPGASFAWSFPRAAAFSPTLVIVDSLRPGRIAPGLSPVSPVVALQPSGWPLRRAAQIALTVEGSDLAHAGLYVSRGASWVPARSDTARRTAGRTSLEGQALTIGRVAAFRDVASPRIGIARTVRIATPAPARWALQCAIVERGSGIDAGRTHFLVDGRKVPSEWDAERGILRWRPLRAPAPGAHAYQVVATDRAGRESRGSGRFVVR